MNYHGIILYSGGAKINSWFILSPPPVKHFMCQMVHFCAKTNQFYSIFSWGGPRPHPFSSSSTVFWQYVGKKKKLRGTCTNKKSHKKYLLNPIIYPPPPFFFCLLNLRSEVRTPPPPPPFRRWGPPPGKTILDKRLHSTDFFKTDFHMVSADQLSFHLWQPSFL